MATSVKSKGLGGPLRGEPTGVQRGGTTTLRVVTTGHSLAKLHPVANNPQSRISGRSAKVLSAAVALLTWLAIHGWIVTKSMHLGQ